MSADCNIVTGTGSLFKDLMLIIQYTEQEKYCQKQTIQHYKHQFQRAQNNLPVLHSAKRLLVGDVIH